MRRRLLFKSFATADRQLQAARVFQRALSIDVESYQALASRQLPASLKGTLPPVAPAPLMVGLNYFVRKQDKLSCIESAVNETSARPRDPLKLIQRKQIALKMLEPKIVAK
jgi:hypothetical protein